MFKEKMVTPAIPERVYALCKIVEKGPITTSELKEKMEPDFLQNKSSYFNDYRNAAEELGLISISDDLVSLAAEKKVTESYKIPAIHSPKSAPLCHLLSHFSPNTAVHSVTSNYQIFNLFFYIYALQTFPLL